jgi:hypothetical protein
MTATATATATANALPASDLLTHDADGDEVTATLYRRRRYRRRQTFDGVFSDGDGDGDGDEKHGRFCRATRFCHRRLDDGDLCQFYSTFQRATHCDFMYGDGSDQHGDWLI